MCLTWNSDIRRVVSVTVSACYEQWQPEKRDPGESNAAVPPVPSVDVLRGGVTGCVLGSSSGVSSIQG